MNLQQFSRPGWLIVLITVASTPIVLLLLGIMSEIFSLLWGHATPGVRDTTIENAVFWGGFYFALPCGVLDVFAGISALSGGWLRKRSAIPVIILGSIGALMGLMAWVYFYMVSSIVF